MRRFLVRSLLAAAALMITVGIGLRINAEARTKTYFYFRTTWKQYWPVERGTWFPLRFRSRFEPFVPVRVQVEPGVNLLLNPADYIPGTIFSTLEWEPEIWAVIRDRLPEGGTFVDVGAHIGYVSLKAARHVGPSGHVYAVEPNPPTLRQLRDNVAASGAGSVLVLPFACSDSDAELEFHSAFEKNTASSSLSSEVPTRISGGVTTTFKVRARPLDSILREAGAQRVDVIKIDVEGAELRVLKGAVETLRKHRPTLIVEMLEKHLVSMGTSGQEVTAFLASLGYRVAHRTPNDAVFAP